MEYKEAVPELVNIECPCCNWQWVYWASDAWTLDADDLECTFWCPECGCEDVELTPVWMTA